MNIIKNIKSKLPTLHQSYIPCRIYRCNISTSTVIPRQTPRILIGSAPESANLLVQARNPSIDKYLLRTSPPMLNWYFQPSSAPVKRHEVLAKSTSGNMREFHTIAAIKSKDSGEAETLAKMLSSEGRYRDFGRICLKVGKKY